MCSSTSGQKDVSGVAALVCGHGVVLAALNIPVGEKWAYAIVLLLVLLDQNTFVHTVWYDINCRWSPVFLAWAAYAACTGCIPSWLLQCINLSRFPLPPFHVNMHKAACQRVHGAHVFTDVALGSGEPAEQFWAPLGKLKSTTRYMHHHHRNQRIADQVQDHNHLKDVGLASHLKGRIHHACKVLSEAVETVACVSDYLGDQVCSVVHW
jgi:Kyakuja-Dileera-Zisupton transposase